MPIEHWSETVVLVELQDDPGFTDDMTSLLDLVQENTQLDVVLNFSGVNYLNSSNIAKLLKLYKELNGFLMEHSAAGTYLFEDFGLAEAVFAPVFKRFWFLDYYENFELPESDEYARVKAWRDASMSHPATLQVSKEEIVKLYYDYALGAGNGALLPGREISSFAFEPAWQTRPWPPKDKYAGTASDRDLGLLP